MPSVTIHTTHAQHTIALTNSALNRVRAHFNPSASPNVNNLKLLAAAFLAELERQQDSPPAAGPSAHALREYATAATHMQTACMFAVAAATEHLNR